MALIEAPPVKTRVLLGQVFIFAVWLAITGFGIYLSPDKYGHGTHQQLGLPPCPSVLFFDRPCPGCGLTTSWTAFIHGHWAEAFHAHPLGPFLYLGFTWFALANLASAYKKRRLDTTSKAWSWGIMICAVTFFGFGILRFILTPHYASPGEVSRFVHRVAGGSGE